MMKRSTSKQMLISLTKKSCLHKKLEPSDRDPLTTNIKEGNNIVLEFSSLSFELARTYLNEFYDREQSPYFLITSEETDETGSMIVRDILRVHNKTKKKGKGKYLYTINCLRTTSKMLINGEGVNRFTSEDFPEIQKFLEDKYNVNNEVILKRSINNCIKQVQANNVAKMSKKGMQSGATSENAETVDTRMSVIGMQSGDPSEKVEVMEIEIPSILDKINTPGVTPLTQQEKETPKSTSRRTPIRSSGRSAKLHTNSKKTKYESKIFDILHSLNCQIVKQHEDINNQLAKQHQEMIAMTNQFQESQNKAISGLRDELECVKQQAKLERKKIQEAGEVQTADLAKDLNHQIQDICDTQRKLQSQKDKLESMTVLLQKRVDKLESSTQDNGLSDMKSKIDAVLAEVQERFENLELQSQTQARTDETTETHNDLKKSHPGIRKQEVDCFESSVKEFGACKFQGFAKKVKSKEEVEVFVNEIKASKNASHNMVAYRYKVDGNTIQDGDDNDETGSSEKILDSIIQNNCEDVAVIVSRWYGGTHIYEKRWELILECTEEALIKCSHTVPSPAAPVMVLLQDSTGRQVNEKQLFPSECNSRILKTPTLDAVKRNIENLPANTSHIIVMSGINDLSSIGEEQTKRKIQEVISSAKVYHPKAKLSMCSIINKNMDVGGINNYIRIKMLNCEGTYIDTTFLTTRDFFDSKHPNTIGTRKICGKLKESMGLKPQKNTRGSSSVNLGYQQKTRVNYRSDSDGSSLAKRSNGMSQNTQTTTRSLWPHPGNQNNVPVNPQRPSHPNGRNMDPSWSSPPRWSSPSNDLAEQFKGNHTGITPHPGPNTTPGPFPGIPGFIQKPNPQGPSSIPEHLMSESAPGNHPGRHVSSFQQEPKYLGPPPMPELFKQYQGWRPPIFNMPPPWYPPPNLMGPIY